jgi:hypothetical protein
MPDANPAWPGRFQTKHLMRQTHGKSQKNNETKRLSLVLVPRLPMQMPPLQPQFKPMMNAKSQRIRIIAPNN